MKDYSDLTEFSDKKLRTLRNNINNRLQSFKNNSAGHLPPSHMLSGMEQKDCDSLLEKVQSEMRRRAKA
jgi:hypothetical protein